MAYVRAMDRGAARSARERRLGAWTVAEYLIAYGLAVIAPILIFASLLLHHYGTVQTEQLEQNAQQIVRGLSANVDRELGVVVATLESLAASPRLSSNDYAGFRDYATAIAVLRPNQRIVLSDVSGRPLVDTRVPSGEPLPATVGVKLPSRSFVAGHAYISGLHSGDRVTVTIPIVREANIVWHLSMSMAGARLNELLDPPNLPVGWQARILDRRGQVVASSADAAVDWQLVPTRVGTEDGVLHVKDAIGQDTLIAFAQSSLAGWTVQGVTRPATAQSSGISWRFFALAGGTLLVVSLLLAFYFGRRLARPIRLTALAASAYDRGEDVQPIGLRLREVDEVLRALKTASTQRQFAEDQLRVAHERMMLALAATDMGMWERDLATNKITWSDPMFRIFGRTREEFSGTPEEVLSYVHPEDRARFREAFHNTINGDAETFEHETRIVRPTGEVRWVYRRAFVRRGSDGKAMSVLGVAIDVTERKAAESVNTELAAIVASSSEAILSVSLEGTIATWNSGAKQMFGWEAEEAVGLSLQSLFANDRLSDWRGIRHAMQAGETVRLETVCCGRDRRAIEVSIIASPVKAPSRPVTRYSITMRDISERKEHDRHLAGVMRELTHRSKNLLAVVQAMARQTALRSDDLTDFEARFSGRLHSLSRSHELLIGNDWEGATLSDLVSVQRVAFGPRQKRIHASGPDVFLSPEAIINIGLAFHELASNAERHGALTSPTGRVDLEWKVEKSRRSSSVLVISWRETGATRAADFQHKGFGRDILEHVAPTALGGSVVMKSSTDSLLWTLEVPYDDHMALRRRNVA